MSEPRDAPPRLRLAGLYALTPDRDESDALSAAVAAAIKGGATAIQYRNKSAPHARRHDQAARLRALCAARDAMFIVNDDVELAHAVAADGVHLGRDDSSVGDARAQLGPSAIIGASCYDSLDRAASAVAAGADYIAFGSFHPSATKPDAVRAQPHLLTVARSRWPIPVVAIGGITAANARPLIAAGADTLAVLGGLFDAADVETAARELCACFPRRMQARTRR